MMREIGKEIVCCLESRYVLCTNEHEWRMLCFSSLLLLTLTHSLPLHHPFPIPSIVFVTLAYLELCLFFLYFFLLFSRACIFLS